MALSDTQVFHLAKRMNVPLIFCDFKTNLHEHKLQYNKAYIVNLEDEFDKDGKPNDGSHYTAFQVNKYHNGKIEKCYFDSYGQPPPKEVCSFIGMGHCPYNTKDIQSLMNNACGWYCLAWLYFINCYEQRSRDLYCDCEAFTSLFHDLDKTHDHKYNEFVLHNFFREKDPEKRKKINIWGKGEGVVENPEMPDPKTIFSEYHSK